VTDEDIPLEDPRGFTRDGFHRTRWWYSYPWRQTRPWLPRWGWGDDEFCNPTWYLITPLGEIVIRYRRGPISKVEGSCAMCRAFENYKETRYKDWTGLLADTVYAMPEPRPLRVTVWPPARRFVRARDVQIHGVGWTMTWRKRFKDWDLGHAEEMVRDYLRCQYDQDIRGLSVLRLDVEWKDTL
jgi:hypothetical protein